MTSQSPARRSAQFWPAPGGTGDRATETWPCWRCPSWPTWEPVSWPHRRSRPVHLKATRTLTRHSFARPATVEVRVRVAVRNEGRGRYHSGSPIRPSRACKVTEGDPRSAGWLWQAGEETELQYSFQAAARQFSLANRACGSERPVRSVREPDRAARRRRASDPARDQTFPPRPPAAREHPALARARSRRAWAAAAPTFGGCASITPAIRCAGSTGA